MKGFTLAIVSVCVLFGGISAKAVFGASSDVATVCAGSDGSVLIAHEDCDKFYQCSGGVPITIKCGSGLLFNDEMKYCDWPDNVVCGSGLTGSEHSDEDDNNKDSAVNDDPTQAEEICAADGSDDVLVAHEDCDKFYKCSEGKAVTLLCSTGPTLYFNPEKLYCDWPENVDCGSRNTNTDNEVDNSSDVDSVDGAENGNNSNDNDDNSTDNEGTDVNDDPSQAAKICAAQGSDGILVAHEDCDKFYKCSEGKAVTLLCSIEPVLYFNPEKLYCDWPEYVDCGSRNTNTDNEDNGSDVESGSIVDGSDNDNNSNDNADSDNKDTNVNEDPSEAAEICSAEGSDGVLVAHEDCDKFYKCSRGEAVLLLCSTGPVLYFDPEKLYCDWPENVDCGSRNTA